MRGEMRDLIKAGLAICCCAAPVFAQAADDDIDVRGGIFGSRDVSQDFFSGERRQPAAREQRTEPKEPASKPKSDSFDFEGSADAAVQEASQRAPRADQVPDVTDSRFRNNKLIVNQAAETIRQLKGLQSSGSDLDDQILKSGSFIKEAIVAQPTPGEAPRMPTPMLQEPVTAEAQKPTALGSAMLPEDKSAPVMISLVVSAFPESHLRKQLALLRRVHVEQNVPVGDVVIAGGYKMFMIDQQRLFDDYAEMAEKEAQRRRSYPRSSSEIERMIARGDSSSMIGAANVEFSSQIQRAARDISDADAIEVLKTKSKEELEKAKWTSLSRKSLNFAKTINSMSRQERERLTALAAEKYSDPDKLPSFVPDSHASLARMGLYPTGVAQMPSFLRGLEVQTSPVWLISVGRTTHVFEGEYDPRQLFSVDGKFIGPRS